MLRRRVAWLGVSLVATVCWVGLSPDFGQASASRRAARKHALVASHTPKRRKNAEVSTSKVGVAATGFGWNHAALLHSMGASWAFNGGPSVTPDGSPITWIPEVQNSSMLTPRTVAALTAARRSGRAQYLLGFNEPDNAHQSDMTPAQAAALWPQLQSTGLQLGSPATDWVGDGWLGQFMKLAAQRHLRVSFIELHYYLDFTNPSVVASLRQRLIKIHDTYHKPIWITEIGTEDLRYWGERMTQVPTEAMAARYVGQLFTMLNALPFVQRYAWYTDDCIGTPSCVTSSLFTGGGQLTPVGLAFKQAS